MAYYADPDEYQLKWRDKMHLPVLTNADSDPRGDYRGSCEKCSKCSAYSRRTGTNEVDASCSYCGHAAMEHHLVRPGPPASSVPRGIFANVPVGSRTALKVVIKYGGYGPAVMCAKYGCQPIEWPTFCCVVLFSVPLLGCMGALDWGDFQRAYFKFDDRRGELTIEHITNCWPWGCGVGFRSATVPYRDLRIQKEDARGARAIRFQIPGRPPISMAIEERPCDFIAGWRDFLERRGIVQH